MNYHDRKTYEKEWRKLNEKKWQHRPDVKDIYDMLGCYAGCFVHGRDMDADIEEED